jgi:hypothetical protein
MIKKTKTFCSRLLLDILDDNNGNKKHLFITGRVKRKNAKKGSGGGAAEEEDED